MICNMTMPKTSYIENYIIHICSFFLITFWSIKKPFSFCKPLQCIYYKIYKICQTFSIFSNVLENDTEDKGLWLIALNCLLIFNIQGPLFIFRTISHPAQPDLNQTQLLFTQDQRRKTGSQYIVILSSEALHRKTYIVFFKPAQKKCN